MKIKVKANHNREEYDEFISILDNIKTIQKRPNTKIKTFTRKYISFLIAEIILLIFDIFIIKNGGIWYFYFGIIIMLLLVTLALFINGNSKIKYFQKNSTDSDLIINKKEIEVESDKYRYNFKWEDIKYIVSNKYTICLIPNKLPELVCCFPIEIKDEFLKAIYKYNKEDIFIDNENLYK